MRRTSRRTEPRYRVPLHAGCSWNAVGGLVVRGLKMESPNLISLKARCWLWIAAWCVAFLALLVPMPFAWRSLWMFPLGLYQFMPRGSETDWRDSPSALIFGWAVYAALTIYALRQIKRARYFASFALLCGLLLLNLAGCYHGIHTARM